MKKSLKNKYGWVAKYKKCFLIFSANIIAILSITHTLRSYVRDVKEYIPLFFAITILFATTIGAIMALLLRVEAIEQEIRDLRELQKKMK